MQDRVREAFAGRQHIELLFTNLSREQEDKLRAAWASEPVARLLIRPGATSVLHDQR